MIKLELTQEEAQQLMLMIDLAVRAQGVRLAAQAATMAAKVEAAAKRAEEIAAMKADQAQVQSVKKEPEHVTE